jgi:hypothetical protein
VVVSAVALVRVPFRVRREFLSLRKHDDLFRSQPGRPQ